MLYFQVADAAAAYHDKAARTAFFANIDLAVNVLTLVVQIFATGPILRRIGVMLTLALLPAASVIGFGVLAAAPSVAAIVAFQVFRRAGNFAIARPTREILYTVVPARRPLQGEKLHRYGDLPTRRSVRRLVDRPRARGLGHTAHRADRDPAVGALAARKRVARPAGRSVWRRMPPLRRCPEPPLRRAATGTGVADAPAV